jgi:MSHA biogenesis protein MshM
MYNAHYRFDKAPFKLTPDTHFFCRLKPHEEAFKTLLVSLEHEEGFIKITGPVGTGKTMLCRQLISHLDDRFTVACIPNPALPIIDLYRLIVNELKGDLIPQADHATVFQTLNALLTHIKKNGKKAVLIIDEAQTMSDEGLEAVRLLTNLETETGKLLQVILFGQPELDTRLEAPHLLQLKQRIIFSYRLTPLSKSEFLNYVSHRVIKAGYSYHQLFDSASLDAIYKASGGIPRVINILCHKALIASYANNDQNVTKKSVRIAIKDTMGSEFGLQKTKAESKTQVSDLFLLTGLLFLLVAAVWHYWLGLI